VLGGGRRLRCRVDGGPSAISKGVGEARCDPRCNAGVFGSGVWSGWLCFHDGNVPTGLAEWLLCLIAGAQAAKDARPLPSTCLDTLQFLVPIKQ